MREFGYKNPFMDYRNTVPVINLSGFVVKQPILVEEMPAKSLQEQLLKKKLSNMINLRRLRYCKIAEGYRNGRI